jgi:hypothetical protein
MLSDMPKRVTIERASLVAREKSFEAPVDIWPTKISSAIRPPNRIEISSSILSL